MKIREIAVKEVYCAKPEATLSEVAALMRDHGVGVMPVCEGKKLVGIITDRDIVITCAAMGSTATQCKAKDFMTKNLKTVSPDVAARNQPTASPLHASVDQLRGLPPALIITGECDVLRDEGESYARKLIEADVTVTATRYLAIHHDFVMLNVVSETPAAHGAIAQANDALRKPSPNKRVESNR